MTATMPAPRRSASVTVVLTEARLFLREPIALVWGMAFPVVLLVIIGSIPGTRKPSADFGGTPFINAYLPVLIGFVIAMCALNALPPVLAGYRERGILKRLSTTPVGPSRVLAAQLAVNLAVVLVTLVLLLATGRIAFDVPLPHNVVGFALSLVLGAASVLAMGTFISAVTPGGRAANAVGAIAFFPTMFFAGLWLPRAQMPHALRAVSDATPLGSAVQALYDTARGDWPHPLHLAVMAGYLVVFGLAAARFFRWQ